MTHEDDRWVAKVHPLDRSAESDDPLELMAEAVPGDPDVMLECVLQEFAWMGWDTEQLWSLFHHPGYPVLCQLREFFGDEELRRRLATLAGQWGVLRFQETVVEPDDDECAPPLVQITVSGPSPQQPTRPGGDVPSGAPRGQPTRRTEDGIDGEGK